MKKMRLGLPTSKPRWRALVPVAIASALACLPLQAQEGGFDAPASEPPSVEELGFDPLAGMEAEEAELSAWKKVQAQEFIGAREQAEAILSRDSGSFVAHMVLGFVQHYAEANFPRALFHLERAKALFEARHGAAPASEAPWRWHLNLLKQLATTHGTMEHHERKLAYIAEYNQLYEPDMIAERAWPLMKLGRYEEARLAAQTALGTERADQHAVAYNALCAIEFEAGNDGASYQSCRKAVDEAGGSLGRPSAVDLTNYAEAARSLFRLDEAERAALEATRARLAWYGNPWVELAQLYTREGRLMEALAALREVPAYRGQRPPHVRNADRNEARRVLAGFLVVAGLENEAARLTHKALIAPDRRAHNSRDPAQDRTVLALLDRRARRMDAERMMERAAARPWLERPALWAKAWWQRLRAWRSGSRAERLLAQSERLGGTLQIGTSRSAIMPPWLAGELVELLGAGVVRAAVAQARAADEREGSEAYYDAFEAEAALVAGEDALALQRAEAALTRLQPAEALLRARVHAIAAEAARRRAETSAALRHYGRALQTDPGVFRRLELPIPVRIRARGDATAEELAGILADSPRLEAVGQGMGVHVDATRDGGEACLIGVQGEVFGCGRADAEGGDDAPAVARRITEQFHAEIFAPRLDLSQADIHSLDGSNVTGRSDLSDLLLGDE